MELFRDDTRIDLPTDDELKVIITDTIINYTNNIREKTPFVWSELITEIHNSSDYIIKVITSSTIEATVRNPLTLENISGFIIDSFSFDIFENVIISRQLSMNTIRFYTDSEHITIEIDN
jgi:hypothetical protein